MLRKPFEWLWLSGSKTRRLCPSEAKPARFQASLSSPFGRGTMPAQPSNGFLTTQPPPTIQKIKPACFRSIHPDIIDFIILLDNQLLI
jgi:hypothetical protein